MYDIYFQFQIDTYKYLQSCSLRLSVYDTTNENAESEIDSKMSALKEILGDILYSEEDDTLEACIGRMLSAEGMTVSAAESVLL